MDRLPEELSPRRTEQLLAFNRLLDIMDELREKCPWDRKQTLQTLRTLTLEEVYELSESILENNLGEVKKELGDVMLHLVFYSKIASESGAFDVADVLNELCEKLIVRHPHIYGTVKADTEEQVKLNWEQIKIKEGNSSALSGVPASLPAMVKAMRIQEKARGAGFDWDENTQVWEKVKEELGEFQENFNQNMTLTVNPEKAEDELGDVLFSLINFSRFAKINPDTALERTNQKFIRRFQFIEKEARAIGKSLAEMNLEEMDRFWEKAKKSENNHPKS